MAKEVTAIVTAGSTVYFQVWRLTDGKVWNTAGTPAFENYATANIADYDVSMTQQGTASGVYCGDFPSTITVGSYYVIVYIRAGGAPAETDTKAASGVIHWTGTVVIDTADVNVKTAFLPSATAGAAGGVFIAGSNAATTAASLTLTSNFAIGGNLSITGNFTAASGFTVDSLTVTNATTFSGAITATNAANDIRHITLKDGSLTTAKLGAFELAKTTNITGFNDIAATAIVSAGAITTLAGAVVNVDLVDTLTTYTGNTVQTGDSFARIGATGSGLTSLAPSATALSTATWTGTLATNLGTTNTTVATNLDATISSRMATYVQPTGFLAATFPLTVASTTNITAATGIVLSGVTHTGAVIPTVTTVGTLTTYTGNTPQTGDAFARLGAPAGASIAADLVVIDNFVDDLEGRLTALRAGYLDNLSAGAVATQSSVDIIDDFLDTEIAAIKAKTDQLVFTVANQVDANALTGGGLDAAATRAALGLATANLDTQLGDLPTAAENAAALMDLSNGIETSITPRQAMRLMLAAMAGKLSGAASTTITIRNVGDSKDRITATVDADGNRTAITTDAT